MPWFETPSTWEQFCDFLTPKPGEKILDVGAGKGAVAGRVHGTSQGALVYAVDPNKRHVSDIRRVHPAIKASVAGAEMLPFPGAEFDKVYSTLALHHYTDLDGALSEISRVLKHGGLFVVLEAEPHSLMGRFFRFFGPLRGEHVQLMSQDELVARVVSTGRFTATGSARQGSTYLVRLSNV